MRTKLDRIRLIGKWLKAGVLDNGVLIKNTEGAPQGGPISPILANIYLHYVLDLWFEKVVKGHCRGRVTLVRFADDFIVLFEYPEEASRVEVAVRKRMDKFGLALAEEKTRTVPFGRYARRVPGKRHGRFEFLGFEHLEGRDRKGKYAVVRVPTKKSCRKFLDRVKTWLRVNKHKNRIDQRRHLEVVLRGFYQYFALPHCKRRLKLMRFHVTRRWRKTLRGQSQRTRYTWARLNRAKWFLLPGHVYSIRTSRRY